MLTFEETDLVVLSVLSARIQTEKCATPTMTLSVEEVSGVALSAQIRFQMIRETPKL
jgi:hypothetical protein